MAKCKCCGKTGLFLKLKDGFCSNCHEETKQIADKLNANHEKYLSNPFNRFIYEYGQEAKKFENAIISNRLKLREIITTEEKINIHKENIQIYESLKAFCLSKGEGGKIFFERRFEHCHNSNGNDFSFIQKDIDALNKLTK